MQEKQMIVSITIFIIVILILLNKRNPDVQGQYVGVITPLLQLLKFIAVSIKHEL